MKIINQKNKKNSNIENKNIKKKKIKEASTKCDIDQKPTLSLAKSSFIFQSKVAISQRLRK